MRGGPAAGGLAGIAAVVLAVAARALLGGLPRVTDPIGVIALYLAGHRAQILLGAVLQALAMALLPWFAAALGAAFRRAGDTSEAPAVVLAGFTVVATAGLLASSAFAGMTYTLTGNAILMTFATAPYVTLTVTETVGGIAVAVPLAAAAVAIARTRVLPPWTAWFAGLVALVRLLVPLGVGLTDGALVPGGPFGTWVPEAATGLWLLTAAALLLRGRPPATAVRPHGAGPGPS